jgi:hypothetical protein
VSTFCIRDERYRARCWKGGIVALMTTRVATCSCGQLRVRCAGEPVRISICHCFECQRRTGSVFGVQARFTVDNVAIEGESRAWVRTGDSGGVITTHFCPHCGSTVHWAIDREPHLVGVAIGAFADPSFPAPRISIYEAHRHAWADMPALAVEHFD